MKTLEDFKKQVQADFSEVFPQSKIAIFTMDNSVCLRSTLLNGNYTNGIWQNDSWSICFWLHDSLEIIDGQRVFKEKVKLENSQKFYSVYPKDTRYARENVRMPFKKASNTDINKAMEKLRIFFIRLYKSLKENQENIYDGKNRNSFIDQLGKVGEIKTFKEKR